MRILFTGASSFTGYWFVRQLAEAGHEVTATFQRSRGGYEGLRAERVAGLAEACSPIEGCSFGDDRFLELLRSCEPFDVLCHHAADVTDYKSADFDVCRALRNNTASPRALLQSLADSGCRRVVLTGSVFEHDEGAGSEGLPAFSPYGLSKALTAQVFRYYCGSLGIGLGKFVIPNPFGPLEEPRFTTYLARRWLAGEVASVKTPAYVRDNIHVSLLARAYVQLVEHLEVGGGGVTIGPSGYPASQGCFARLFADAMRPRLGRPCELSLEEQTDFSEPRVRINTDLLDAASLGWHEDAAWDELASYYLRALG